MKRDRITDIGKKIETDYNNTPGYWNSLPERARLNNSTIYVFKMKPDSLGKDAAYDIQCATPTLSGYSALEKLDWTDEEFEEYIGHVQNGETRFSYLNKQETYLLYGGVFDYNSEKIYVYVSAFLDPADITTTILSTQLGIVSVICILLSVAVAWFVSRKLTMPIRKFSLQAQELAKGDFNVKFEQTGYNELNDLADTLNYATEEMGKTEEFRREFIANVSHDLRTPLTMIKAYAEMIRDISGKNDEKRTQHAQTIINEADRLNSLVADIQNLSKLQAGTDVIKKDLFDLSELCDRTVKQFSVMHEKFGYILKTDIAPDITAYGDEKKIEQVLYNLLGNAVNYTGEDKKVMVSLKTENDLAVVSITDTGKGIAPEEIKNVWDRYYRINQHKRNVVGSGLGLSIVKNIFILHGAQYGIDSEINKGSTFWFKLPLDRVDDEADQR